MISEREIFERAALSAAESMCAAACTAPKACGRDSVRTGILTGAEVGALAAAMREIRDSAGEPNPIFLRDAELVERSLAVVLIGSIRQSRGMDPCGLCGYSGCGVRRETSSAHCAFDDVDLGIAAGSAAALAADRRIDNRILYTAGLAAAKGGLLGANVEAVLAIPLSISSRNPYFYRKPTSGC